MCKKISIIIFILMAGVFFTSQGYALFFPSYPSYRGVYFGDESDPIDSNRFHYTSSSNIGAMVILDHGVHMNQVFSRAIRTLEEIDHDVAIIGIDPNASSLEETIIYQGGNPQAEKCILVILGDVAAHQGEDGKVSFNSGDLTRAMEDYQDMITNSNPNSGDPGHQILYILSQQFGNIPEDYIVFNGSWSFNLQDARGFDPYNNSMTDFIKNSNAHFVFADQSYNVFPALLASKYPNVSAAGMPGVESISTTALGYGSIDSQTGTHTGTSFSAPHLAAVQLLARLMYGVTHENIGPVFQAASDPNTGILDGNRALQAASSGNYSNIPQQVPEFSWGVTRKYNIGFIF